MVKNLLVNKNPTIILAVILTVLDLSCVKSSLNLNIKPSEIKTALNHSQATTNEFFFQKQRRGTNLFDKNEPFDLTTIREKFKAIRRMNLDFVRMTPSKWKSAAKNAQDGDFLIGPMNSYKGIYKPDLSTLIKVLDIAAEERVKVVLVFLNIPNRRWRQHTRNQVQERKIWEDFKAQDTAVSFFDDLMPHIRNHPALAGINPLNEPKPEAGPIKYDGESTKAYAKWYESVKGTPQDINLFYRRLVERIRHWSANIPIILDVGEDAWYTGLSIITPIDDEKIIYSFHMYAPFRLTFKRVLAKYPGFVPYRVKKNYGDNWDKNKLEKELKQIEEWRIRNRVNPNRIFVGEFGIHRDVPGAVDYMKDIVSIFEKYNWHHAYYSFREDNWKVMDSPAKEVIYRPMNYELGIDHKNLFLVQNSNFSSRPNYRLLSPSPFMSILKPRNKSNRPVSPLMGWNSWNWFGKKQINEKIVEKVIDAMSDTGLVAAGYKYIVVDGGWRAPSLGKNRELLWDQNKFPKGIKFLADLAHTKGLQFGLHVVPGTHDCGMDPVGSYGVEELHAKQLVSWGVDFIKLDACVYHNSSDWPPNKLRETVQKWRHILDEIDGGKNVHLSVNAMGAKEWYRELATSGRTSEDIRPKIFGGAVFDSDFTGEFLSVMDVAEINSKAQSLAGNGYWNDADMLVVGDPSLTQDEQMTHFALWSLMTSPLMLGNDPRNMNSFEKKLLTNPSIIAVNQDPTEQGYRIQKIGEVEYWRKRLNDGSCAVLVINRGKQVEDVSITQDLTIMPTNFSIYDLYRQQSIAQNLRMFNSKLKPQTSMFFKISPDTKNDPSA